MKFEWDAEKAEKNLQKHGIAFEDAVGVFHDEARIEMYDFKHSIEEDRYIAIGRVRNVLFVVFVERADRIRLISARMATRKEKEMYYGDSLL